MENNPFITLSLFLPSPFFQSLSYFNTVITIRLLLFLEVYRRFAFNYKNCSSFKVYAETQFRDSVF